MPAKVRLTSSVAVGQYGAEVVEMRLSRKKAILSSHLRSPSTPSSSERGSSSLDDAVAPSFTSSTQRALDGLKSTLETFTATVKGALMEPPQRARATHRTLAAQHLLNSINSSASSEGGAWLSEQEVQEALSLFHTDSVASGLYVVLSETQGSENRAREFLWRRMEEARVARASAPGGSRAP
jgi:hypothetical protein